MLLRKLGMLLQECSTKRTFRLGVALHASVVKNGVESDLFLSNHLINMYAKCKDFESSNCIFDHMPIRNIVSWSALIAGYDQASNPSIALNLFAQMPFQPNEYIYGSIISSCATLFALAQGRQVHGQSLKNGYEGISFVYNSLMSMYIKCDCMDDALRIFRSILKPNSISYNAMITGFAEKFKLDKSLELFRLMNQQGLELHCQTVKRGLDTTAFVGNVILKMYSICNLSEEEHMKGLMLFREMTVMENNSSLSPDAFTTASALAICAELALFHYGGQIHAHLVRTWMNLDIVLFNALINMYAKCGCSRYAMLVFDLMPINNVISYNTIIAGLGNHGHAMTTLEIFEQMKREGFTPESVTFIGLLTACSHAGLVDEGLTLFNSMEETYGICPEIEHLSCLIDMLGRSGRLLEAEDYIKMSPYQNDYVIWGNLLSSCRLHKDVAIGERVAIKLLELQPSTSSPYVLLANLYASDGKWEGAAEARKLLRYSRVKKEPGYSLIEVKGVAEKFTVGNFSHEQIGEIVATLDSLHWITGKVHE
ncbi:pentatricopeptide repeat-containing protein At1g06140, mitochondrial-like isoform X7 [Zingiber officinale]|nr:pentatricopeptide repeat-containing protein At1g06140, mitochondrial-like isoform X7 [Zingiber officinale]XP_042452311.1 pentatricopeptide repeat-containing protein At1g06140, mitochondrial-like isoform X7 [Zingiber officinale]